MALSDGRGGGAVVALLGCATPRGDSASGEVRYSASDFCTKSDGVLRRQRLGEAGRGEPVNPAVEE